MSHPQIQRKQNDRGTTSLMLIQSKVTLDIDALHYNYKTYDFKSHPPIRQKQNDDN